MFNAVMNYNMTINIGHNYSVVVIFDGMNGIYFEVYKE